MRKLWLILMVLTLPALAEGWRVYNATGYGLSMLVPTSMKVGEREWGGGWGGVYGTYEGAELWGLARLGEPCTAEEIENYGVKVTGVPGDSWTQVDQGTGGSGGWKWYRTIKATSGGYVLYGGYGVGPKGSYLLIIKTTQADFTENFADYKAWYDSIRLQ